MIEHGWTWRNHAKSRKILVTKMAGTPSSSRNGALVAINFIFPEILVVWLPSIFDFPIYIYMYVYIYMYIYIYVYVYILGISNQPNWLIFSEGWRKTTSQSKKWGGKFPADHETMMTPEGKMIVSAGNLCQMDMYLLVGGLVAIFYVPIYWE